MNLFPEEPSHLLPADRLARRREHLMSEITPGPARPHRARRWIIIGSIATLAVAGGGTALANGDAIWRQPDGSVAIDGQALRPVYQGHYITMNEVAALQKKGKAMGSVVNEELACQGITLYFDTGAEVDAYNKDFNARHPVTAAPTPRPTTDPCAKYTDSPRYVTDK